VVVEAPGRVIIEAELLHLAGVIELRSEEDCERARLEISTDDEFGPAAAAVAGARVQWRDGRLSVSVVGEPDNEAGVPVTITGVVPPGCTLEVETTSATISTDGVAEVDARSQSGPVVVDKADLLRARVVDSDVQVGDAFEVDARVKGRGDIRVDHARRLDARTTYGDITVKRHDGEAQVHSQDGDITVENFETGSVRAGTTRGGVRVNATGPGTVDVTSETGSLTVTADSPETAALLRVRADSRGQVTIPKESEGTASQAVATPGIPTRSFDGRSADRGLQR
jgi:hypothetical protein